MAARNQSGKEFQEGSLAGSLLLRGAQQKRAWEKNERGEGVKRATALTVSEVGK